MEHMDYFEHMYLQNAMNHTLRVGGMGEMSCKDMMMPVCFFFNNEGTVLFKGWKYGSNGELIGTMIGIFLMAVLYEGLKFCREYIFWRTKNPPQGRVVTGSNAATSRGAQAVQPAMLTIMHFIQTSLHMVQMVLSYFLMLIFMTYNIYLCIAIVLGGGIGYFLFGWKKYVTVDSTQQCQR